MSSSEIRTTYCICEIPMIMMTRSSYNMKIFASCMMKNISISHNHWNLADVAGSVLISEFDIQTCGIIFYSAVLLIIRWDSTLCFNLNYQFFLNFYIIFLNKQLCQFLKFVISLFFFALLGQKKAYFSSVMEKVRVLFTSFLNSYYSNISIPLSLSK